MKQIGTIELKVVQMDVLSAIHRFCTAHNIKYSLGCGTMLGCARHKGYIPWDDNIDIYMLRKDYEKLVEEFPDTFEGRYKFVTMERDPKWNRAYGKAYDCTTVFKERTAEVYELGVNIDVFPIDFVPDNDVEWQKYDKVRRMLQHIYEMKVTTFRSGRSVPKNAFMALCKLLLLPFSSRYLAMRIQKMAMRFNTSPTSRVFECCQGIFQKRPFSKLLFDSLTLLPFEDREYMAFSNYDAYLTNGYGNWRQMPPKDKRVSHHAFKAWWKE
jgi:lipopolysaccharide cholinephosphotransferase